MGVKLAKSHFFFKFAFLSSYASKFKEDLMVLVSFKILNFNHRKQWFYEEHSMFLSRSNRVYPFLWGKFTLH